VSAEGNARPRYEEADARPRIVALIAGALAALVLAGLLTGWGFMATRRPAAGSDPRILSDFPGGPEARTSSDQAWSDYEHDTESHLSGYGWIDRPAGVTRIPIDRAIDLVVGAAPTPPEKEPRSP
jgi:hypothetical protein